MHWGDKTNSIHSGDRGFRLEGAIVPPIFQSSTFSSEGEKSYYDLKYIRLSNTPNHLALHEKLATLEKTEASISTSSGMAAITTTLLTLLKPGDHLIVQNGIYGVSANFIKSFLCDFGIQTTFVDLFDPGSWKQALKTSTKMFFVESITNPLMEVGDLEGVVKFSKDHNLISLIDSTFTTPILFKPYQFGFDIVIHSATKYLNGHSDVSAGFVAGDKSNIEKISKVLGYLGSILDPHACFLLSRGLKTLPIRIEQQCKSANELAKFLSNHNAIKKVNYPGLDRKYARHFFSGFGAMISFELKSDYKETKRFLKKLQIPIQAPSLGGAETLITLPSETSHLELSKEERLKFGISDNLVRLSIGLEDVNDLLADFDQALFFLRKNRAI